MLEPYRDYLQLRLDEDPHVFATVLLEEITTLGFDRSYPTLVRELRRLGMRSRCDRCRAGTTVAAEIAHDPADELQLVWLELSETPWGAKAYVLVRVLPYSGRQRGVFSEGQSFAHLAAALDGVMRHLGGSPKSWRTDRMATFVYPGSDRLRPEAAELAKHYGAAVAICPANRLQRKGSVEADPLPDPVVVADRLGRRPSPGAGRPRPLVGLGRRRRLRGSETVDSLAEHEPLLRLSAAPFPAILEGERQVSSQALVAFDGNRYSVGPELAGQEVTVRARLGELSVEIRSGSKAVVARHRRAPAGGGQTIRSAEHARALEREVLEQFSGHARARPTGRRARRRWPKPRVCVVASPAQRRS